MSWGPLPTQFCLELAFGVLAAMAFVPRAPVGAFFYRLMGCTALVPLTAAALLPPTLGGTGWNSPAFWVLWPAFLAAPLYAGAFRRARWIAGLTLALSSTAAGLVLVLIEATREQGPGLTIASLSALATGTVAGSVGLAMVLGHWYLTVPTLNIAHLRRLNRVTVWAMVLSLILLAATLWLSRDALSTGERSIYDARGMFHLSTRVAVGLLLPLFFSWMVSSSLDHENTRSATGILYASTVLVLIGTAASISLQDSYGVPL